MELYPNEFYAEVVCLFPNDEGLLRMIKNNDKKAGFRLRKLFYDKLKSGSPRIELEKIYNAILECMSYLYQAGLDKEAHALSLAFSDHSA